MLTPYLPYPPDTGGKIRTYYLLRKAASKHEVDLFTVYYGQPPEGVEAVEKVCASVRLIRLEKPWTRRERLRRTLSSLPRSVDHFSTPASVVAVQDALAAGNYDLLHVDEVVMLPYVVGLTGYPIVIGRQKVDFQHYREMAAAKRWGWDKMMDWLESSKLKRYERGVGRVSRCFLVCSEGDARVFCSVNRGLRTTVIPNGVDIDVFSSSRKGDAIRVPTLIYTGTMSYYPNVDAVLYFFEQIFSRIAARIPTLRVLIVGHGPPPAIVELEKRGNVKVTGSVPDIRPYMESSTAMVVPLRLGGGTRLKIMEAMSSGLPVVSTSVGCEGLSVTDGRDILIADDPASFAGKAVSLLLDAQLRGRLAANARSLARKEYSWDRLGERLLDVYEEAAEPGRRAKSRG